MRWAREVSKRFCVASALEGEPGLGEVVLTLSFSLAESKGVLSHSRSVSSRARSALQCVNCFKTLLYYDNVSKIFIYCMF